MQTKKISTSLTERQRKILDEKRQQISEFEKKAQEALAEAALHATYFVQGQEYRFNGSLENQLQSAFEILVRNTYSYLSYIEEPVPVKNANDTIYEWATKGLPAKLDGTFTNHLAYDAVFRYLEESRNRQMVTMKVLIDKFKSAPYGWSENDIAGLVAALVRDGKIKLSYLNEAFDVTHPQFIARIIKASEREKVIVEAQVVVPKDKRKKVVEIMRELFNFYDVGETYDDIAKNIRAQLQKHFLEPITEMLKTKEYEDKQYPYPGGIQLTKLKNSIEELLSHSKRENFVDEFIELDEDLEEWLEDVHTLSSFYKGHAIRLFDESVRLLKERADDLDIAKNQLEVQKIKNKIVAILTMDHPYREIPKLPLLNDDLRKELTNFVKKELGAQLEQMEEIHRRMEMLKQQYDIVEIKTLVQQELNELQSRIKQLQDVDSISRIYSYTQMAANDLRRLEDKIREIYAEYMKETGELEVHKVEVLVSNLLPFEKVEIRSEDDVHRLLGKIKEELMKEIQDGKVLVIKK